MGEFLLIARAHLLAAMSPGPDFVMITTRTLQAGKRSGMWIDRAMGVMLVALGLKLLFTPQK